MMTERARALGMTDTSFTNATGLPGANLSTAEDMAKLSLALLREHPKRYAVFSTRSFSWAGRRVQNHNHLLGAFEGADGIKTGYTAEAGFALAASAKRAGRRLIAVVIGERSIQARDRRVERLLDQGLRRLPTRARAARRADRRPSGQRRTARPRRSASLAAVRRQRGYGEEGVVDRHLRDRRLIPCTSRAVLQSCVSFARQRTR